MPTCPQLAYTLDTGPVPGHPTYTLRDFGSDLNAAKDTLYVHALDSTTALTWLALCAFPSMTQIGLHPGPIQLNRPVSFAVGPDGSVYNLWIAPGGGNCSLSKFTAAGSESYRMLQSGTATALIYNPVDNRLYGWSDVGLFYRWDPSTGLSTSFAFASGHAPQNVNTRPVVTADGTVWVLDGAGTSVMRWDIVAEGWTVYPLGFTAIDGLWHGPEANSVAVIDNTALAFHKVDSAGAVTTICTDLPPSDILASTLISDDFSIVLLDGIEHLYRWVSSGHRAGVGRVYIP